MIFGRFLGILTECLGSEANEGGMDARTGLCASTPPCSPLHKGGKGRRRAKQKCAVGNGFYPPKKAGFSSAQGDGLVAPAGLGFGAQGHRGGAGVVTEDDRYVPDITLDLAEARDFAADERLKGNPEVQLVAGGGGPCQ